MNTKSPSKRNTPPGMNQQAAHVWVHVLSRYAGEIFGSGDVKEQWDRACRMYERACKGRGIEPYTGKSYCSRVAAISSALRRLACSSQ